MDNGRCVTITSVANKNLGCDMRGNGHGHMRFYSRYGHIKRAMHWTYQASSWLSMCQVARLQCRTASWSLPGSGSAGGPVAQYTF
jgi:hypothetical protein